MEDGVGVVDPVGTGCATRWVSGREEQGSVCFDERD
jgi:hypothetical protein